jgi:hypothetical protein
MRRKNLMFIFFIALTIVGVMTINYSAASSEATVYVDPASISDPAMVPDTQFTVDIVVENVENLWAYQFWLSFNPKVIQGVSVENGPFLGKDTDPDRHPVEVAPGAGFDNEAGELKLYGAFIQFETTPPNDMYLADGGGVLATVTFKVVGFGKSSIVLGEDTRLADKWADEIPSTLENGFFANADVHDVAVTHISTNDGYCVQGDPVGITVIAENLGDFTETFDVKVYSVQMGSSGEEIFIGIETVEDLAAGDSITLPFVWDTTGVSAGSYYIYAEASAVSGESVLWTTNNIINTQFKGVCVEQYEATLLESVVSWLNFAVRVALPVAVFVTIAVVFLKTVTSVKVQWPTRLSKRICMR